MTFLFSCKKDEIPQTCSPVVNESYFPLTVGSYWVYQWYRVDSLGDETVLNSIDTIRIVGDTIVGVNQYAIFEETNKFETPDIQRYYRRDSLGFLVDIDNNIFFSPSLSEDTIRVSSGGFASIVYQMESSITNVDVLAGNFDCRNFRGTLTPTGAPIPVDWTEGFLNNYYSKGVGLVMENTFFFSQGPTVDLQRRLKEYYIE